MVLSPSCCSFFQCSWLVQLGCTFRRRALAIKGVEQQLSKDSVDMGLRKTLNAFDLVMFGVGSILGSGVFVITGVAARDYAG